MNYTDIQPNPYDANTADPTPETKPLDEIIRMTILDYMMKLRVMVPVSVVTVRGNQKVDVQPLLQIRYTDNNVVNMSVIQNCMVQMPSGQNYSIKLPVAVGDTGYVIVCDRSLDIWASGSGGIVDPQDSRAHDLQDSVFVPGLLPFANQTQDQTDDMVLTNGEASIRIQASGRFKIMNQSNELVKQISNLATQAQDLANEAGDIADTLSTDTVNTMLGPQPLNAAATYASIYENIQEISNQIGDIVTAIQSLLGE